MRSVCLLPAPCSLLIALSLPRRGLAIRAVALVTRGFNRAGRIARPDARSRPIGTTFEVGTTGAERIAFPSARQLNSAACDARAHCNSSAANRFLAAMPIFPAAQRGDDFAAANAGAGYSGNLDDRCNSTRARRPSFSSVRPKSPEVKLLSTGGAGGPAFGWPGCP